MDFDEARAIVEQNNGASMTRNGSGGFCVTLKNGTPYLTKDTVGGLPDPTDTNLITTLGHKLKQAMNELNIKRHEFESTKQELESTKQELNNIQQKFNSTKQEFEITITKMKNELESANTKLSKVPKEQLIDIELVENIYKNLERNDAPMGIFYRYKKMADDGNPLFTPDLVKLIDEKIMSIKLHHITNSDIPFEKFRVIHSNPKD